MKQWAWLALGLAFVAGMAQAADEKTLEKLVAPPSAQAALPFAGQRTQPIRLSRIVVQLKPEPWALVIVDGHADNAGRLVLPDRRLVTWKEGQQTIKVSTLSPIVDEELARAGAAGAGTTDSVFAQASSANLQLGARVTDIEGRFCRYCGWGASDRWIGATIMTVRWEVYSSIDRKVVATIETSGGFNQGKPGLAGDPEGLINEAFRDNVRRLIASLDFQRALTAPMASAQPQTSAGPAIDLLATRSAPNVPQASVSVATVFSNDGSGSGFLISDDGYLLTNHHVVGAAKYVKLKWSDGRETLGEVIRSDARHDVALIKADAGERPALRLRHSKPEVSEQVFAIGSPFGEQFQGTVSKGIVSALRTVDGLDFIQSDVAVNHGNSGGPLLDGEGRVIGMTDWGRTQNGVPVGVNLFIPIDDALKTLNLTPPLEAPTQRAAATPASKPAAKP